MCCNNGISGAAIVLVLFILLIIILGAYIQARGGVEIACQSNNNECCHQSRPCGNNNFVCIIVLYILLAIIIGSAFIY